MERIEESHLLDIQEFEIAIKNMYLKLANLEFEGKKDTEEYQNIFSLLESARRIEKNKFATIHFNENVYDYMKKYFSQDYDKTDILALLENQDFIEGIRSNNILALIAMQYNYFINDDELKHPVHGEELKEELINRKYRDAYDSCITRNSIFIIDYDTNKMPDDELRRYFIYLKYFNIYISPSYELSFINNGSNVTPPININHNKYQVPEYSDEEFDSCNRDNLINDITNDLEYILEGDDETFSSNPYRLDLYRILSLNKARLISLQDKSFISLTKKTIDSIIKEDEEYQGPEKERIRQSINQMFIDSLELLDIIEKKRKLELK